MKLRCDYCNTEFELVKSDFCCEQVTIDSVKLWFTYFRCPWCDKIYPVIIDDYKSRRMAILHDVNGYNPNNKLGKARAALIKKYNHKMCTFEDGRTYELSFMEDEK